MKANQHVVKKVMALSCAAFLSLFILSSCHKDYKNNSNNTTTYTISGNASGTQEVPAVTSSGSGSISGTYNSGSRLFIYTATWNNLSGIPISAGFYNGAMGVSGTLVGTGWALEAAAASGSFTDTLTLTDDQAAQLKAGNWYYSLATATNVSGEIRGQILATY